MVAREKYLVLVAFDVAIKAQTLLFFDAESWYVSMPQIIKSFIYRKK
jgi:hypothetical protein